MNRIARVYAYKHLLLGIIDSINSDWRKIATDLNLTIPQHQLLWAIHFKPGASLTQLAEYSLWTVANVMHVVENLEKKRLAVKYIDSRDNRVKRVYLTEEGAGIIIKAKELAEGYRLLNVFDKLGDEKTEQGLEYLYSIVGELQSPEYVEFIRINSEKI